MTYKEYFLALIWPIQILVKIPMTCKKLFQGESFYAKCLGLFYLRQLRILNNKDIYFKEAGDLKLESFFYQSFLPIYLCYQLMGRRLYTFISISILMIGYYYLLTYNIFIISVILLLSGVVYFLIIERGNYQTFPLVLSILGIMHINFFNFNLIGATLLFMAAYLSVSIALLVSIILFLLIFLTQDISYLYLLTGVVTSFGLNALINIFIIKRRANTEIDLIGAVTNVIGMIGVIKTAKSSKNFLLTRSRSIKLGIFSVLPLLFVLPIYYVSSSSIIFIALSTIMFLNQAKIIRFFDYHFLYSWIFFYSAFLSGTFECSPLMYLGLFILGTNPIYSYALDSYNNKKSRGFILDDIVIITPEEVEKIELKLTLFLKGDDSIIINPMGKITEYNDIWAKESLLLEWIWDSLERNKIKFFPDYYSVFYTENGAELFTKLTKDPNHLSKNGYTILNIQKLGLETKKNDNLEISEIFSKEIMNKHFLPLNNSFLLKV